MVLMALILSIDALHRERETTFVYGAVVTTKRHFLVFKIYVISNGHCQVPILIMYLKKSV